MLNRNFPIILAVSINVLLRILSREISDNLPGVALIAEWLGIMAAMAMGMVYGVDKERADYHEREAYRRAGRAGHAGGSSQR